MLFESQKQRFSITTERGQIQFEPADIDPSDPLRKRRFGQLDTKSGFLQKMLKDEKGNPRRRST